MKHLLQRIGRASTIALLCWPAATQESRAADPADAPLPPWKPLEHPSHFAAALCYVGDVDGDGTGDLAIGGPSHPDRGCVWIVSGITGACIRKITPPPDSLSWTWFGKSLALVGDLDGDGLAELGVGAPAASWEPGYTGHLAVISLRDGAQRAWLAGESACDLFGDTLCAMGDLDRDGVPDFAVGAPQGMGWNTKPGYVRVHSGKDGSILRTWRGTRPGEGFGTALCAVGDVDQDGSPDLAIGAPCPYSSSPELGRVVVLSGKDGHVLREIPSTKYGSLFGYSLCSPGDLNGDGRVDLVVGEPGESGDGMFNGAVSEWSVADGIELRRWGAPRGLAGFGKYGSALCDLGDVDGDKISDYLVSCPRGGKDLQGAVWAFSGATASTLQFRSAPTEGGSFGGWYYGESISRAGDLDRDGVSDFAVGMCSWYSPSERQWVLIYSGKTGRRLAVYQERDIDASPASAPATR
jgi:hypothetical protein